MFEGELCIQKICEKKNYFPFVIQGDIDLEKKIIGNSKTKKKEA